MRLNNVLFYLVAIALCGIWTADCVFDLKLLETPVLDLEPSRVVRFTEIRPIFQERCFRCHSSANWDWTQYPIAFEKRGRIRVRVWEARSMPLGGQITEEERKLIRDWVDSGGQE